MNARFSSGSIFLAAIALLSTALLAVPTADAAKPQPPHWVATWATANWQADNMKAQLGQTGTTLREIVQTTLTGPLVRVEVSNEFGTEPLQVGAVHLALAGDQGAIVLSSASAMTFAGKQEITLAPGTVAVSDPAALTFKSGADLAVSIYLPAQTISHLTRHADSFTTNYQGAGNQVGRSSLRNSQSNTSWYFLKSLQVNVPTKDAAVVAFGDSITDGTGSTLDANNRWVDRLAQRLHNNKRTASLAVVNEGIGGNRVLNDGTGPSALSRFNRDVLEIAGVRYVILLESINDIGHLHDDAHPGQNVSADELTQALTQLVGQAHEHGIKAILATLTPYAGAKYDSPEGEAIRKQVNAWIRSYSGCDGVIDFAAATRDANDPQHWKPEDQAGDQLHPSVAGHEAMAHAVNLDLFTARKEPRKRK